MTYEFRANPRKIKRGAMVVAALIGASIIWPFHTVPTGSQGIITQFGSITSSVSEGLLFVWPWEKVAHINLRVTTVNIDNADGNTSDSQPVAVSLTVRYAIIKNRAAHVFQHYSHDGDLSKEVTTATQEVFKSVTAKFSAPNLIARREAVSQAVRAELNAKLKAYGAEVVNIDMRSFAFGKDYMAAISAKVTQEQLRLGADNKLKTVESEQMQKVAVANAEAQALRAKADGEAYAQLAAAKAQAESLRIQSQALQASSGVLELRRIEVEQTKASKWDGVLPTHIYGSAPIPFLNSPAK